MKKSIISNIIFKSSTWRNILFLLAFVILALAISKYMPFYTEGFQEGLLSSSAITSINDTLKIYESEIDTISADSVKSMSSIKLSTAESVTFASILGDDDLKNTAKIDKITALKSTNDDVKKAIANVNGKKYIATLTMLNTMNKTSYPDDETFTALLKQQTQAAHDIVSGANSVHSQIKDYLKTISVVA